eukprot:UN12122
MISISPNLESLFIAELLSFPQNIPQMPRLRTLLIGFGPHSSETIRALLNACPNIRTFDYAYNNIDFVIDFTTNPNLEELCFDCPYASSFINHQT